MLQQQLHHGHIPGLSSAQEWRSAVLIEPLHGEDGSSFGTVPFAALGSGVNATDARVHVGAVVEQQLDELQVIHVRLSHRVVPALNVAVVDRDVQR